jgi:hypothetical protein
MERERDRERNRESGGKGSERHYNLHKENKIIGF